MYLQQPNAYGLLQCLVRVKLAPLPSSKRPPGTWFESGTVSTVPSCILDLCFSEEHSFLDVFFCCGFEMPNFPRHGIWICWSTLVGSILGPKLKKMKKMALKTCERYELRLLGQLQEGPLTRVSLNDGRVSLVLMIYTGVSLPDFVDLSPYLRVQWIEDTQWQFEAGCLQSVPIHPISFGWISCEKHWTRLACRGSWDGRKIHLFQRSAC